MAELLYKRKLFPVALVRTWQLVEVADWVLLIELPSMPVVKCKGRGVLQVVSHGLTYSLLAIEQQNKSRQVHHLLVRNDF